MDRNPSLAAAQIYVHFIILALCARTKHEEK